MPRFGAPGRDGRPRTTLKVSHAFTRDEMVDLLTVAMLLIPNPKRDTHDLLVTTWLVAMREVLRLHGEGWRRAATEFQAANPVLWRSVRDVALDGSRDWW